MFTLNICFPLKVQGKSTAKIQLCQTFDLKIKTYKTLTTKSCKTLQKVASFAVTINGLSKIYKVNSLTKKDNPGLCVQWCLIFLLKKS